MMSSASAWMIRMTGLTITSVNFIPVTVGQDFISMLGAIRISVVSVSWLTVSRILDECVTADFQSSVLSACTVIEIAI